MTPNPNESNEPERNPEVISIGEAQALSNEVRTEALEVFGAGLVNEGRSFLNNETEQAGQLQNPLEKTAKETALVLWNCRLGTLGSDMFSLGKLIEFDSNRAVIAIDKVTNLGFTWGKTLLKVDVLGLDKPMSFLGIAKEARSRKSDSGLGLLIVSFSQMNEQTKSFLWEHLFH